MAIQTNRKLAKTKFVYYIMRPFINAASPNSAKESWIITTCQDRATTELPIRYLQDEKSQPLISGNTKKFRELNDYGDGRKESVNHILNRK